MTTQCWRLIILLMAVSLPASGKGNENEGALLSMEERLARQEARIEELEGALTRQMAILEELRSTLDLALSERRESTADAAIPNPESLSGQGNPVPLAGWNNSHAFIRDEAGQNVIRLRGRIHFDYRGYTANGGPPSTFVPRRMRLGVEGEFGDNYSYVLTGDFADPEGALVQDGYFDITFNDAFQLRAGQFKAPFSQETLQSDNRIMFVERSSLSNLAPSRTPGLMLSGSLINGRLSYNVDAYNGRGRVSSNDTSTPEIGARLRFQPFRGSELFENLAFGGAYTQGRHLDGSSFAGRTASRSVTFFRRIPIRGKTTRTNAEFEWVTSQFSMRGEYMQTNQARDGLGPNGNNLPGVVAKGYMVEAGYVLGGTNQSNALVVPRTTFLEDGGLGALQLAVRYENLQIDDRANPNRADAYTIGVNWQFSRFVRHMSNFSFERFQHPNRNESFNEDDTFTYVGRMQLNF